ASAPRRHRGAAAQRRVGPEANLDEAVTTSTGKDGQAALSRPSGTEIAIIGMAIRVPGAADVAAFWRNLRDGVESTVRYSAEELRAAGVAEEALADPNFVPVGAPL